MSAGRLGRAPALTLAVLLGACAGGPEPAVHYYELAPPAGAPADEGRPAVDTDGLTIGVDSFAVDPPYDQDRLVYRLGADGPEVGFYHYHRWAAPLGRLAAVAIARGLEGARGVATIEPSRTDRGYQARLEGRVVRLEEVDEPGRQAIHLIVELALTADDGGELWTDRLAATSELAAPEPGEVMAAVRRAWAELTTSARRAVEEALAGDG